MTNKTNRKKSRKLLFQELYAMCFNKFDKNAFNESFFDKVFTFTQDDDYTKKMHTIIKNQEPFFILMLKKYTPKFSVETMSLSYVLPIYIGLAEMFYLEEEIPGKVSINEAVEIAKVYGDDSSKKIVNGVLNQVFQNYDELLKEKDNKDIDSTKSFFK